MTVFNECHIFDLQLHIFHFTLSYHFLDILCYSIWFCHMELNEVVQLSETSGNVAWIPIKFIYLQNMILDYISAGWHASYTFHSWMSKHISILSFKSETKKCSTEYVYSSWMFYLFKNQASHGILLHQYCLYMSFIVALYISQICLFIEISDYTYLVLQQLIKYVTPKVIYHQCVYILPGFVYMVCWIICYMVVCQSS